MSAQSAVTTQADSSKEVKQEPAISLPESQTTTALALVTQSITELNKVALEVAALEPKYKGVVFDVKTTAGMKVACEARLAIRKPRYTIQKMQKDAKTPLNALKKGIDDQVDAVIARITAIEDPIHEQISNEETRKENEKKAREVAEAARIAAIRGRIEDDIRAVPLAAMGRNARHIQVFIGDIEAMVIDHTFAEFQKEAEGARATTLIRLRAALANAQAMEAEQERLAAERAENERVARENERIRLESEAAAKAERERLAAEERVAKEARDKASAEERARIAEEERVAREAREKEAAELREAAQLNQMRMSEIHGIQQQVIIAQCGRLGVREGGTIECIRETLAETEKWPIEESSFGPMTNLAQSTKDGALKAIRELLAAGEAKAVETAEAARQAAEIAAAAEANAKHIAEENAALLARQEAQLAEDRRRFAERKEAERIEAERQALRDAEERRLTEAREQLARDQAALKAEREKPAIVTTISEGADIREDSVRQARDTPWDALSPPVDDPTTESGSVAQAAEQQLPATGYIDIVFDGPPSVVAGRFVEVEDSSGKSISVGEWVERPDKLWALRINAAELGIIPAAWMRGVTSPGGPWGPSEHDVECYAGDDPPDNSDGWIPLYRKVQAA